MRKRSLFSFAGLALLTLPLWAAPPEKRERELHVPFDDLHLLLENKAQRVWMTRAEFEALKKQAEQEEEINPPVSILPVSAAYEIQVEQNRARIEGTLHYELLSDGVYGTLLDVGVVGLQAASLDDKGAPLARNKDGGIQLFLSGKGTHVLNLSAVAPLETTAARQILNFRLPMTGATRLKLTIPGDVEVKSGAAVVSRDFDADQAETRFELLAQRGNVSLVMSLNSRLKRKDRIVVARSVLIDEVTQAYERLHATVSFDVLHRAVSDFQFRLPEGFEVTDVQSPLLAHWAIEADAEGPMLSVTLREETTDTVVLNVSAFRTQPDLVAWTMPRFEPLNVVGHSAVVGVLVEDRLYADSIESEGTITVDNAVIMQALPQTILNGDSGEARVRPLVAYYTPRGAFSLTARFRKPAPRREVTSNLLLSLADEGLRVQGGFMVVPREEKQFDLEVLAPQGWEFTSVTRLSGEALPFERYDEGDAGTRVLVRVPGGMPMDEKSQIFFSAKRTPQGWFDGWETRQVAFPVFRVKDAESDRGAVAVTVEDDLEVRPVELEQVAPLDENEKAAFGLSAVATSLAYRYEAHPYRVAVDATRIEPRLTAETYSFFQVKRDIFIAHYELIYLVEQARTRSLKLALPKDTPEALSIRGLKGARVKEFAFEETETERVWTVHLAAAAADVAHIEVDFQQPYDSDASEEVALPVIRAEEVVYQSGLISVEGSAELDVRVTGHPRKVDIGELAEAEYLPGRRLLGAYGFLGTPEPVKIEIMQHETYPLPPAIVELARIESALSASGRAQSFATFRVKSKAAFLEIELPKDSELWSVTLNGTPVKPQRRGLSVLIALPSRSTDKAHELKAVYETPVDRMVFYAQRTLKAPALYLQSGKAGQRTRVPVTDLQWSVWIPEGFKLINSGGNVVSTSQLTHTPAAVTVAQFLFEAGGGADLDNGLAGIITKEAAQITKAPMGRSWDGRYEQSEADAENGFADLPQDIDPFTANDVTVQNSRAAQPMPEPPAPPSPPPPSRRELETGAVAASTVNREETVTEMMRNTRQTWNRPGEETPDNRTTASLASSLEEKMSKIIIPSIEFRDVNIHDVIQFLTQESIDGDPDGVGINTVLNLQGPGINTVNALLDNRDFDNGDSPFDFGDDDDIPRITLSLRRVSLLDAVRYITEVANLKYRIENNQLVITPANVAHGRIVTRVYPVMPSAFENVVTRGDFGGDKDFITMDREDSSKGANVRGFFENMGVPFPAGTTVTYNPTIGAVVVANTPENLEILDRVAGTLGMQVVKKQNWALEGANSLKIDPTREGHVFNFNSLGELPELTVSLTHQRRMHSVGWAVFFGVFLLGLLQGFAPVRNKIRYIILVLVVSSLLPALPGLGPWAEVFNGAFYAGCWLIPFYLVLGFGRKVAHLFDGVGAKTKTAGLLLIVGLFAGASDPASAETTIQVVPPPQPIDVPADVLLVPTSREGKADRVMIPYAEYRKLYDRAHPDEKQNQEKPPAAYALAGADYSATLSKDDFLEIRGKLDLELYDDRLVEIPLSLAEGVLAEALLDGKPARLSIVGPEPIQAPMNQQKTKEALPEPPLTLLYVSGKGRHQLEMSIRMKLVKRGGWRVVEGRLPAAPATALNLTAPDAETEIQTAGIRDRTSYKTLVAGEVVRTVLGTGGKLSLHWRPKISEGETDQSLTATSRGLLDIQEDHHKLTWDIQLSFRRGEREFFTLDLPEGYLMDHVEGINVKGWAIDEDGRKLTIALLKRAEKQDAFQLHLWRPVTPERDQNVRLPYVQAEGAIRHTGHFTVRRSPLLALRVVEAQGVSRMNLDPKRDHSLMQAAGNQSPLGIEPFQSYEFVATPFAVDLDIQTEETDVTAKVQSLLRLAERERTLESRILLHVRNRPIYQAAIRIPADLHLESVNTAGVFEYAVTGAGETRTLTLYFAEGRKDQTPVVLHGRLGEREALQRVQLPKLEVLDVARQEGDIAVQTAPAFDAQTEGLQGIESILLDRVYGWLGSNQRSTTRLALHYEEPGYGGTLVLAERKPDVTVYSVSNVQVTDRIVGETILFDFTIRNAGIRQVQFEMAASLADARISVPLLREKTIKPLEGTDRVLVTLDLQDGVMNELRVLVEHDRLLTDEAVAIQLPVIRTGRVDRQYAALESGGRDEVVIDFVSGLETLSRQRKEWATVAELLRGGNTQAWLSRPGAEVPSFVFRTKQRTTVETAGAGIGLAKAVLMVDDHGAYRARQTYFVDNRTEQFLAIRLPESASLWTARVAGENVKPIVPDAKDLRLVHIPLVKTAAGDLDYEVVLKYGGRIKDLAQLSSVSFPLIRTLNINVEKSQVELLLPATRKWFYFGGSMRRETELGGLEAGALAYQVKKAKSLVQTLKYGNEYSKVRALGNLKSLNLDLEQQFDDYNYINPGNKDLQDELQNVRSVLKEGEEELTKAESSWEAESLDVDNRYRFNDVYDGQANSLEFEFTQNFSVPQVDEQKPTKPAFNPLWLDNNALAQGKSEGQEVEKQQQAVKGRIQTQVELVEQQGRRNVQGGKSGGFKLNVPQEEAKEESLDQLLGTVPPGGMTQNRLGRRRSQRDLAERYQTKLSQQQGQSFGGGQSFAVQAAGEMHDLDADGLFNFGEATFGAPDGPVEGIPLGSSATAGLASLDVNLPAPDRLRWRRYQFTTPLGDVSITSHALSNSWIEGLKRLAIALVALLILSRLNAILAGRRLSHNALRYLSTGMLLLGIVGVLVGVLPVWSALFFFVAVVMKIVLLIQRFVGKRAKA